MKTIVRKLQFLAVAGACLALSACGGSGPEGPELHPVSGKLTKGGEPLANVQVTLSPTEEGNPISTGKTGQDGSFTLSTPQGGEGAAAGTYKVVLARELGEEAYGSGAGGDPTKEDLPFPEAYQSPDTTPKEVTVNPDGNDLTIDVAESGDTGGAESASSSQ